MSRTYKITTKKAFRDQEAVDRFKERVEEFLGEDAKVIVLYEGMDLNPVEQEYYGIQLENGVWLMDDYKVLWYPCREIAEAHASKLKQDCEVVSFNGIEDASDVV